MDRRSFLYAVGGAGLGIGGFSYYQANGLSAPGDGLGLSDTNKNGTAKSEQTFGPFASNFESARWTDDNTLVVTFPSDHELDGFGIHPPNPPDYNPNLLTAEVPDFGGEVEVDLLPRIIRETADAGSYSIVGYKGNFGSVGLITDEVGSVSISVVPDVSITAINGIKTDSVSLQVDNHGNAPAYLRSLVIDGEVEIGAVVGVGETVIVTTNGSPFETDGNCVVIPPTASGQLRSVPRMVVEFDMDTQYDEEEHICTI